MTNQNHSQENNKINNIKVFLDSGDANQTKQAIELYPNLAGQTTNPSLIVKNPKLQDALKKKTKVSKKDLKNFYQETVQKIKEIIPQGWISIEVYVDNQSTVTEILSQAEEMSGWIEKPHIKFPITDSGLQAATTWVKQGGLANITLIFSQAQALAIHRNLAKFCHQPGQVLISPFIGRLEDQGYDGVSLVKNILKMYQELNSPIQVLAASIRNTWQLNRVSEIQTDIVTLPLKVLQELPEELQNPQNHLNSKNLNLPNKLDSDSFDLEQVEKINHLQAIKYKKLSDFPKNLDIKHFLTDQGLDKFVKDWQKYLL